MRNWVVMYFSPIAFMLGFQRIYDQIVCSAAQISVERFDSFVGISRKIRSTKNVAIP